MQVVTSVVVRLMLMSLLGAALSTSTGRVRAADPPPAPTGQESNRELALRLAREGVAFYNEQRLEDAFDRFANAEGLVHSPVFVLYMARIERKRGKWLTALRRFDAVVSESLPKGSPAAWQQAKAEAGLERQRLAEAMPTLEIQVGEAPAEEVSIWIDGLLLNGWREGAVSVNPGKHQVVGQLGDVTARARVEVDEGQKAVPVQLRFPAVTPAGPAVVGRLNEPAGETTTPAVGPGETADAGPGAQRIAGYVLLATGGAGVLATLGVGIGAFIKNSELSDQCLDDRCPRALEEDVNQLDELTRAVAGLSIASAAMLITGWIVTGTAPTSRAAPGDDDRATLIMPEVTFMRGGAGVRAGLSW
jgi:hypothetical protein